MQLSFLVGTCLVMLLQQDLLPDPEQRLAAVTLLHELYKGDPIAQTPFASVFVHLLVCRSWESHGLLTIYHFSIRQNIRATSEHQNWSIRDNCLV